MPFRPGRFGKPSYMETYDGVLTNTTRHRWHANIGTGHHHRGPTSARCRPPAFLCHRTGKGGKESRVEDHDRIIDDSTGAGNRYSEKRACRRCDSDERPHGSSEPIQSPDDQRVAGLQGLQAAAEARPVVLDPGQLVGEDRILADAVLGEGVDLQAEILVICADAGVSDTSPAQRRRVHGRALCRRSMVRFNTVNTRPPAPEFRVGPVDRWLAVP